MAIMYRMKRKVEFSDTDMAGIVHFSRFFCFMEAAEHELLRSVGLSVMIKEKDGKISFPRVSAKCDYLKPARFEEELTIEAKIARVGKKSITYTFTILKAEDSIARGSITTVCCNVTSKGGMDPITIPTWIREKLDPDSSMKDPTED